MTTKLGRVLTSGMEVQHANAYANTNFLFFLFVLLIVENGCLSNVMQMYLLKDGFPK